VTDSNSAARFAALEGKIEVLAQKVESSGEQTKLAIEGLTKVTDERWRAIKEQAELSGRQQQQAVELLKASHETLIGQHNSLRLEVVDLKGQHAKVKADVNDLKSTQQWLVRLVAAALILAAIGAYVKFGVPPAH
jgi:hypothetical protein